MLRMIMFFTVLILLLGCRTPRDRFNNDKTASLYQSRIDSLKKEIFELKNNSMFDLRKAEPGKVYMNCALKPVFDSVDTTLIIYTGKNVKQRGVVEYVLRTQDVYLNWEKIRISEVCDSEPYPDLECMAWFYKEYAPTYRLCYVVEDTSLVHEWEYKTFTIKKLVQHSQLTNMRALVCPSIGHTGNIEKLKKALLERGYKVDMSKPNIFTVKDKEALIEFQRKNKLPVGHLDYDTFKALGI